MLRTIRCALSVGLLCAATAQASTTFIDFNQDPIAEGKVTSITGTGFSGGQWMSYDGIGYSTNGSDGFLQLTAAVNSQNGIVIFPDFDAGAVVQGFEFDCWVRVGNGTETPADGFSISYARTVNPLLFNSSTPGNSDMEEGTRTGIAIGFDCYNNNTTPPDPIALDIWVDGVQIYQYPFTTQNGLVTDRTSLQTGPYDGSTSYSGLGWAHLKVSLSTSGLLNVYYKDFQILTNYATGYIPGPGQLVMAGRTGGLNENQGVDNITITTTVAQNVTAGTTATGLGDGVSVPFYDSGAGVVDTTKPATVSIDGAPAVPASAVVKQGTTTQVIYYGYPTLFVPGSAHHVVATVTDVFGRVTTSSSLPFTVGAFSTVNSALAVTGVDTGTKGFRIKPWQSGIEPNNYWWANEQLVGLHGAINPLCDLTGAINGYFNYTGVINFDYTNNAGTMGQNGSFQLSNGYEATQLPGIVTDPNLSGTPANTNVDNCALEILSFLHFQNPGVYTMGVISDDGFNVTVGTNPADWGSLSVGSFNGGRGADAGTTFTFIIPAAGYYPFRLVWENGGGGANVEWFVVQPGGTKILVNDPSPTNTTGVTAYYGGPALPAFVSDLIPWPDSTTYQADQFKAMVTDLATTVTAGTLTLSLDGAPVSAVSSQTAGVTTISVGSGYLLPLGKHTAQLVYGTSAGTITNTWNFTVANYLLPTWAVTGVDTTKTGFLLKPYQSYVWPNSYGAQPNTVRYTLEQLAGLHGPNAANLTTATDGGFIDYFADPSGTPNGLINFNMSGSGGAGNFADDRGIPGLTLGTDVPDSGNQSISVLAFLQFDQAGVYTMGINSDDGFAVYAGVNPRDWATATLLGQFDGGRGPADTTFSIYVPAAGTYPIRMIYYNGNAGVAAGNGAECEWFVVQPDGTKILLNDPAPVQDTHVKAFYKGPALPAFVSAFCPANGATGVSQVGAAAGLSTTAFGVQLTDGSTTVTPASIAVSINGVPRTPTVSPKVNGITTVTLPGFLPAGTNRAELVYSTSGGGPFTFTWNFTVVSNTLPIVNSAWAVTGVDTTKQGFRYRPWQSGNQPNNVWWTEEQLAGFHGPNNADLSILNDGTYYDYTGLVNFDTFSNADGDFTGTRNGYTDINFPGIPGANGLTGNSSFEMLTFIQFNQVGVYSMCVNSDDGFKVTVGPNPADWFALNLGEYNGGRGSGFDGGTTFSFVVTNTGFYPFRLIWENGNGEAGNGANCEWTMVQPDGSRILINDPNAPENTLVTAYYKGPALAPGITAVTPTPGTSGDLGGLQVKLADGNPAVTANSITLTIDGVAVAPTLLSGTGFTTITYDKLAAGAHTAILCYSTSAGGPFCTTWNFTTTPAPNGGLVLSTNLWTPPGSGSNPGFAVKVFQTANTNILNGWQNNTRMADMMLQGLYGPSVADPTDYTNNGAMWWPGVINFSQNDTAAVTDNGNFRTTTYPDAAIPGLGVWDPTLVGLTQPRMDRDAMEVKAFLEFASPGYYVMGVNSDDGFRVTEGDQGAPGKSPLALLAPAGVVGEMTAMYTTQADGDGNRGFGGTPSSTTPIIRRVVAANPITVNGALVNASALQGNIALVARGDGIAFAVKAKAAQDAGALAVIIANNSANDSPTNEFPGTLGGADATVTIPCLFVNYKNGTNLIAHATTDTSSPLIARITAQDCSPIVGYIDIGKGASDVLFGFTVPRAGVYPFRLVWENGNGDANCEWFIRDPVLGTYLVNQPGSPVKAWITRDVHAAGALPAPKLNTPTLSGGKVIISWTGEGELWESYSLNGPWFKSTYQANPSAVTPSSVLKASFFRVRQY